MNIRRGIALLRGDERKHGATTYIYIRTKNELCDVPTSAAPKNLG